MRSYATGIYPVDIVVTATYANGTPQSATSHVQISVVNTSKSDVARGWTIAGVPQLYVQADTSALVTDGAGSATVFSWNGAAYVAPSGDYTTLRTSGGLGGGYVRTSLDNTNAWFSASGRADSATDRLGFTTRFGYDTQNRLHTIYDPQLLKSVGAARAATVLNYGSTGLSSIQEPAVVASAGRITQVQVDADSLLRSVTDPDALGTAYDYDGYKRLKIITDRYGNATQYAYGATWKLSAITSPAVPVDAGQGSTVTRTPVTTLSPWQNVGVPTDSTHPTAVTPAVAVVAGSIAAGVTDPNGLTTSFTVNRWGQQLMVIDPIGNHTYYTRAGTLLLNEWLPSDKPIDDGHGSVGISTYTYDGPLLRTAQEVGKSTVTYTYGMDAQVAAVSGEGVMSESRVLNSDGQVSMVEYANDPARVVHYAYDVATKRVDSVTEAGSHLTTYRYDPVFDNLIGTSAPGGRTMSVLLDAYGRDTAVTATGQGWHITRYDIVNRAVYDSAGGNTGASTIAYAADHTTLTGPVGQQYRTDYNALGWTTATHHPNAALAPITYRYDVGGRLKSTTNRRGQRVDVTYDALGRVLSHNDPISGQSSFTYSPYGLKTTAINTRAKDSTIVDLAGRTDSTFVTHSGESYVIGHSNPDAIDSVATADVDDNDDYFKRRIYHRVPKLGMSQSVALGPISESYTYDPHEALRLTTTLPGGGLRTEAYTTSHHVYATSYDNTSVNAAYQRAYHYDVLGRNDFEQNTVGAGNIPLRTFSYDTLGRLKSERRQFSSCGNVWPTAGSDSLNVDHGWQYQCFGRGITFSYDYDAVGNVRGATYQSGNRLMTKGSLTFEYAADGNMTRKLDASTGEDRRYYWDAESKLDSMIVIGGSKPGILFLQYDAHGRLLLRNWYLSATKLSTVRLYLYSGDNVTKEISYGDGTSTEYEYEGTDRPIMRVVRDGNGVVVSSGAYLYDQLGNVIGGITNGTASSPIDYLAWGTSSSTGTETMRTLRFGFKGMLYDEDAQMYYARARWYDPSVARFISEDPIGLSGGVNQYVFAGNDPVNGRDPNGAFQLDEHGGVCRLEAVCGDPLQLPGWATRVFDERPSATRRMS